MSRGISSNSERSNIEQLMKDLEEEVRDLETEGSESRKRIQERSQEIRDELDRLRERIENLEKTRDSRMSLARYNEIVGSLSGKRKLQDARVIRPLRVVAHGLGIIVGEHSKLLEFKPKIEGKISKDVEEFFKIIKDLRNSLNHSLDQDDAASAIRGIAKMHRAFFRDKLKDNLLEHGGDKIKPILKTMISTFAVLVEHGKELKEIKAKPSSTMTPKSGSKEEPEQESGIVVS